MHACIYYLGMREDAIGSTEEVAQRKISAQQYPYPNPYPYPSPYPDSPYPIPYPYPG